MCTDKDGKPEPDPEFRGCENVPLKEDIREYFEREVTPHVPDAPECVEGGQNYAPDDS